MDETKKPPATPALTPEVLSASKADSIGRAIVEAASLGGPPRTSLAEIQAQHHGLGKGLFQACPPDVGFVVMMGHKDSREHFYSANMDREQTIRWLKDVLANLKSNDRGRIIPV